MPPRHLRTTTRTLVACAAAAAAFVWDGRTGRDGMGRARRSLRPPGLCLLPNTSGRAAPAAGYFGLSSEDRRAPVRRCRVPSPLLPLLFSGSRALPPSTCGSQKQVHGRRNEDVYTRLVPIRCPVLCSPPYLVYALTPQLPVRCIAPAPVSRTLQDARVPNVQTSPKRASRCTYNVSRVNG